MIFGTSYRSTAVVPDGTPPPALANPITDYVASARPGSRAPHVWFDRAGRRVSTISLLGRHFVLLAGPEGGAWCEVFRRLAAKRGVPFDAFTVGDGADLGDPDGSWRAVYGVEDGGAVLIRPDGHVAWRCPRRAQDTMTVLGAPLATILGAPVGAPS